MKLLKIIYEEIDKLIPVPLVVIFMIPVLFLIVKTLLKGN
jgi:hypothetical protein